LSPFFWASQVIIARAIFACIFVFWSFGTAGAQPAASTTSTEFDYFVFALSWSPGFCDLATGRASKGECAPSAMSGFVVHGLWPTRADGDDLTDCGVTGLSRADIDRAARVFPTDWLARHEFQKHGTCSGMSASAYFDAIERLRGGIAVPAVLDSPVSPLELSAGAIKGAFMSANPNLRSDNMAVVCARKELVEVRFCLSRDLSAFAVCTPTAARDCQASRLTVAPVQ
jgi:ribonuclease T2